MENNKKSIGLSPRIMKTWSIIPAMLLFIFCASLVHGQVSTLDYSGWEQTQGDSQNWGRYDSLMTQFDYSGYAEVPVGDGQQIVDLDLDQNGYNNIALYQDNYVYLFDSSLDAIYQKNNFNPVQSNPVIMLNLGDEDSPYSALINVINNQFAKTQYNVTTDTYSTSYYTIPDITCTAWDGLKLRDNYLGFGSSPVYGVCSNGTETHMITYNPGNNNITVYPSIGNTRLSMQYSSTRKSAGALADIENDDVLDYVFVCDRDNNGKFGVCILNETGNWNMYFNGNGSMDDLSYTLSISGYVHNPIVIDIGDNGDNEIILGYTMRESTAYPNACSFGLLRDEYALSAIKPSVGGVASIAWRKRGLQTGTNDLFWCKDNTVHTFHSQPFIARINSTTVICQSRDGAVSYPTASQIGCVNLLTGTTSSAKFNIGGYYGQIQDSLTYSGASMRNGNSYTKETDNWWVGGYLVNVSTSGATNLLLNASSITGTSSQLSITDANSDGQAEPIATTTGFTRIFYSGAVGGVVNPNAEWLTNVTNGGIYGYYSGSPICKGTNITFGAYECPHIGGCSYTNEIFSYETERLVANCGNSNTVTGSFSTDNPTVSCSYPITGTFNSYIYLQDSSHLSDTSQVQSIVINVIDGIPGTTCNIQSGYIPNPDTNPPAPAPNDELQQETQDAVSYFFSVFTGGNAWLKLIIGIGLIIAILLMVAEYTTNGLVLLFSGVLATILMTALGFIPIYILILFIVTMVLIIMLISFVTSSRESG